MAQTNDEEFLDTEDVKAYVGTNGVAGLKEFIEKKLEGWKEITINMAITGDAGSGKSTFINVIRDVADDDYNAAEVGVTQTTTVPTCYAHPNNDKIKLWDLPGIGTTDYPNLEIYCKKVKLESYDTFLIFTESRFTKHDLELARKIRSLKKNFFFIRTKIDENVLSETRKKSFNEEVMLNEIKDSCSKNLGDLLSNSRHIFLISNHEPEKWDFARLTKAILDVLPIRQREALTLSLDILTNILTRSDTLQRKVKTLKRRIWLVAAASAAASASVALVPLPGLSIAVNLPLVINEIRFYRSQLGLPAGEGSSEFLRLSYKNQGSVRMFFLTTAAQVAGFIAMYCVESIPEELLRFVPFVGLVIASGLAFGKTYMFLKQCLTKMEKTAFSLLDDVADQSISNFHHE